MISYVKSSGDREILGLVKWPCNTIKAQGSSNSLLCHPQQDSERLISSLRFVLFMPTKTAKPLGLTPLKFCLKYLL